MTVRREIRRWMAPLLGVVAVVVPAIVEAQVRWGRPATPRAGACFYRDAGFRGDYFCLRAGEDLPSVPAGLNDEISSFRTFGEAEVTIFRDRRFSGKSERFAGDVQNLRDQGWNDRLSSMTVRTLDRRRGDGRDRGPRRSGDRVEDRRDDRDDRRDDRRDARDDRRDARDGRGNAQMTRATAQEIVRRAYLSELRREPDPGSAGWVDKLMNEGWTEANLVQELRRSAEYRNRRP